MSNIKGLSVKNILKLIGAVFLVLLVGCGGGGGSAGTSSSGSASVPSSTTVATPLFTTAPDGITLGVGSAQDFNIDGGVAPYTAVSNNVAVSISIVKDQQLTIGGVSSGNSEITVRDSLGETLTIAVTVPTVSNLALFTTAPSPVTIAISATPMYSVGGGTPPYTSTSNNERIATTAVVGSSTLTITGLAVGSATISVRDSAGAVVNVNATIGTAPLAITPNNATGIIADTLVATITGGTAPFRASVGNTLVASASVPEVPGNQLDITLKQVGQTVVTVLDANDQSIPYTLTVNAATPGIRLSPNPLTVSELDTADISLTVYGAAEGVANVFSSDTSKLVASINNEKIVTLKTGTSGNRCIPGTAPTDPDLNVTITVVDSTRASGSAIVTIKNSISACP